MPAFGIPVFQEMGTAFLLRGDWEVATLGVGRSWSWLAAPQPASNWRMERIEQVLVLAENLSEAQPEPARSGLGAFSCGPSRSSQASNGTATNWASAAQALSLVPWHDARPSLAGSSFPWH